MNRATALAPRKLTIRVVDRADLDQRLDDCVLKVRAAALSAGDRGILITRHTARDFTIELHPEVPFGCTYERQEWRGY